MYNDRNPNISLLRLRDGRAVGVEYVPNPRLHREGPSTESTMVYAKKLVVVTAGAFGSPLILERSGIGAADILKAHDIVPVVDLPGVGENYQGSIWSDKDSMIGKADPLDARPSSLCCYCIC